MHACLVLTTLCRIETTGAVVPTIELVDQQACSGVPLDELLHRTDTRSYRDFCKWVAVTLSTPGYPVQVEEAGVPSIFVKTEVEVDGGFQYCVMAIHEALVLGVGRGYRVKKLLAKLEAETEWQQTIHQALMGHRGARRAIGWDHVSQVLMATWASCHLRWCGVSQVARVPGTKEHRRQWFPQAALLPCWATSEKTHQHSYLSLKGVIPVELPMKIEADSRVESTVPGEPRICATAIEWARQSDQSS